MKISQWTVRLAGVYFVFAVCQAFSVAIFANLTTDFLIVVFSQGTVFVVLVVYGMVLLLRPEGVHSGWLVGWLAWWSSQSS